MLATWNTSEGQLCASPLRLAMRAGVLWTPPRDRTFSPLLSFQAASPGRAGAGTWGGATCPGPRPPSGQIPWLWAPTRQTGVRVLALPPRVSQKLQKESTAVPSLRGGEVQAHRGGPTPDVTGGEWGCPRPTPPLATVTIQTLLTMATTLLPPAVTSNSALSPIFPREWQPGCGAWCRQGCGESKQEHGGAQGWR